MTIEEFKEVAKKKASKASKELGISDAIQKQLYELGYTQGCFIGAEFMLSHQWRKVGPEPDSMPEDGQCVLVKPHDKLLVWNEYHNRWDYEDGDDFYCKREDVTFWCPIPRFIEE
ncbi:hypothetical protein [Parabacteroides pacaensis]|uniref:hypothetical protein n=1 Tax=Parabacteroides pacaensis TaxID=2086575 RepID=UPI000D1145B7|nr:hypothetical protein [Parabacteroides pacaensis]